MTVYDKLKEARNILGLSQSEAAFKANLKQKDLSLLEGGNKKFVPEEYIQFLYNEGIDINSIYDLRKPVTLRIPAQGVTQLIEQTGKKYDATPIASGMLGDENTPYITNTPAANSTLKTQTAENPDPFLTRSVPPTKLLTPQIISTDNQGKENILHVSVKAAAGYLAGYGDRKFAETLPSFSLPGLNNYSYRSFEVSGDSMYPTLENKEMVIGQWVEGIEYIREDRVHIVVTKQDGIVIKRLLNRVDKYGYVVAKSDAIDNRNLYPNLEIYPDDILEIWYAVWHGSFNFKSPGEVYKRMNNLEADLFELMRQLKAKNILDK